MAEISINPNLCDQGGICAENCPTGVYRQSAPGAPVEVVDPRLCINCGHCVALCPNNAITHSGFPEGSLQPVDEELMPTGQQLATLLRTRRSVRSFTDRVVEREVIHELIEAARYAPNALNTPTTEILVVVSRDVLDNLIKLTVETLHEVSSRYRNPVMRTINQVVAAGTVETTIPMLPYFDKYAAEFRHGDDPIMHGAPCLLVLHAQRSMASVAANAHLALSNAMLMASALGLGAHCSATIINAMKHNPQIARLLSIPEDHFVYGTLVVGYARHQFRKWIVRPQPGVEWI